MWDEMNTIAIDPSKSSTGIFCKVNNVETSRLIKTKPGCSQGETLPYIYKKMCEIVSANQFDLGFIEMGTITVNPIGAVSLFEVSGVIRLACAQHNIPMITVPIPTWKSLTIGVRTDKKNKTRYLSLVKQKYGIEFKTTDQADAYMIYCAIKEISQHAGKLTDAQQKIYNQISEIKKCSTFVQ